MLAGRLADTAPFGWNGNGETVQEHLSQTFRRLGGRGLRGQEMDALLAYLGRMKAPAASESERHLGAERTAAIARGKELFHSSTTECASCHTGASTTDGKTHDIGAKAAADTRGALDTPSLRFVGGTAPYFHDGRYATLRDVLTARDHAMGQTRELSPADVDALEAYLSTL
jgi:cytochrome c peroxidase